VALLIAVILMLLISAIGIAALQHARQEAMGSGRSRHHTRNLHAADGILQLVVAQLSADNPANRQLPIDFANFIQDPLSGVWTRGKTGTIDNPAAEPIRHCGNASRSGDAIGQFPRNIYCVNVLASDGGGRVGLQAQYAVLDASGGGNYR
jgi:hypothetical protein